MRSRLSEQVLSENGLKMRFGVKLKKIIDSTTEQGAFRFQKFGIKIRSVQHVRSGVNYLLKFDAEAHFRSVFTQNLSRKA